VKKTSDTLPDTHIPFIETQPVASIICLVFNLPNIVYDTYGNRNQFTLCVVEKLSLLCWDIAPSVNRFGFGLFRVSNVDDVPTRGVGVGTIRGIHPVSHNMIFAESVLCE